MERTTPKSRTGLSFPDDHPPSSLIRSFSWAFSASRRMILFLKPSLAVSPALIKRS